MQEVKPPTFVKLNERGGYRSQHAENYRLGGAVSFRSAYTQVAGNPSDKPGHGWNTLTTAVLEGLNVLDIVTADRIVCQISTDHPPIGYVPTVTFLGTRFENLRIAGHTLKVDLDLNILGDKPKNDGSYTSSRDFIKRTAAQRDRIQSQKNIPTEISSRYNRLPAISAKQGKIECSLVNQSEGGFPGRCFGNALDVPNFGKIFLATLLLEQADFDPSTGSPKKTTITLNMIEMAMGCVGGGDLTGGGGKTNGGTRP
ncbi:MAG TPA: hypothetical protein VK574_15550 [Terracidiphilus sp.]|nr:hypothetical protein [Terracidiphilus sp.]